MTTTLSHQNFKRNTYCIATRYMSKNLFLTEPFLEHFDYRCWRSGPIVSFPQILLSTANSSYFYLCFKRQAASRPESTHTSGVRIRLPQNFGVCIPDQAVPCQQRVLALNVPLGSRFHHARGQEPRKLWPLPLRWSRRQIYRPPSSQEVWCRQKRWSRRYHYIQERRLQHQSWSRSL